MLSHCTALVHEASAGAEFAQLCWSMAGDGHGNGDGYA